MLVLGVNKILNWCQIVSGGRKYTCPTKLMDGKLFFKFNRKWFNVAEFATGHTHELVSEGGKNILRSLIK